MSHPDKYLVGLLSLGMAAVGMLTIAGLALVACAKAHWVLPRNRSRTTYWVGMVVLAPLWLATFPLSPKVMGAVAVIASFGWDAYADGLRVAGKHGQLSDGRFLSVFWAAAAPVGCILLDFAWAI